MFDAIPTDADVLLDPGWLSEALSRNGNADRIVAVEHTGASRTVAEKIHFAVTLEAADGSRRRVALCAKGHFGDGINSLRTEAHVYRDLLPALDVRAPNPHYVAIDDGGDAGLIVMDDVVAQGGRFFEPTGAYSVATCRETLDQLARLHAATWGDPRWDVDWLSPRFELMTLFFPAERLQQLLDDGRADDLPAPLRDADAVNAAMAHTAAVAPTCVIHGDTHSGNAYTDADGRVCWLDWQICQRGHWVTDVSYHLGTVLDVETRRAHEVELLEHYLEALGRHGAPAPGFDEAWDAYRRGFVWGYFLWSITHISSREVVMIHVPRLGAALTDHDTFRRLGIG